MLLVAAAALLVAQAATPSAPAATPSPPLTCAAEVHSAFDFWVGRWDVYASGRDVKVADSRIEKVSGGCAILENWMPARGPDGKSLTAFDPQTGRWHQLWIGGQPGRVFFDGGPVDGAMILTGYWGQDSEGQPSLVRMTYTVQEDGSVRQFGEASSDHGRTWSTSFDFTYRRKE